MSKAKNDAEHLLAEANAKIENTIREIREAQAEKEKTRMIRKDLEGFRQKLQNEELTVQSEGQKLNEKKVKVKVKKQKEKDEREISTGDSVRMKGQQTVGTVIDTKDNFFVVAFGAIKTAVKAEQLEKVQSEGLKVKDERPALSPLTPYPAPTVSFMSEKKLNFKLEIDVRGMRGNEALQAVMYYIDDAIQCNAGRVRILHGTGTGALRQIIRDYLKTVQGVKRFQDEHVQFGGAGITVVELE